MYPNIKQTFIKFKKKTYVRNVLIDMSYETKNISQVKMKAGSFRKAGPWTIMCCIFCVIVLKLEAIQKLSSVCISTVEMYYIYFILLLCNAYVFFRYRLGACNM